MLLLSLLFLMLMLLPNCFEVVVVVVVFVVVVFVVVVFVVFAFVTLSIHFPFFDPNTLIFFFFSPSLRLEYLNMLSFLRY